MINVNEGLANELAKSSRVGIRHVIEVLAPSVIEGSNVLFEIPEFTLTPSIFDTASNVACLTQNLLYNSYNYHDFFSWEKDGYNTLVPKKKYRTKNIGELDNDYYEEYATGIISSNVYTGTSPFFSFNYRSADVGDEYNIKGIVLEFGIDETIYPTSFTLEFSNYSDFTNGIVTKTINVIDNTSLSYVSFFNMTDFYNLKVTINEMNRNGVKLRISKLMLGYVLNYDTEIMSVSVKRFSDPVSASAPSISLSFTIWDENEMFDPQNSSGIFYSIRGNEIVKDYLFFNGVKELIGTYALDGRPKVEGKNVTFTAKSGFWSFINSNNYKFVGSSSESIQDYANDCVVASTGWYDYFSGGYTGNYNYSYCKGTATEIIQKYANVMFAMFLEDKYSRVTTKQLFRVNGTLTPLNKIDAVPLSQDLICGEITIDVSTEYADDCNVNWYSAGDVAGYVDANGTHAGQQGGATSNFVVDNDMIVDSGYHAPIVNSLYNYWLKKCKKYIIPYLADPRIEDGDFISFDDKYGNKHYAIVVENNYSSPVSFGDTITAYSVDDVVV